MKNQNLQKDKGIIAKPPTNLDFKVILIPVILTVKEKTSVWVWWAHLYKPFVIPPQQLKKGVLVIWSSKIFLAECCVIVLLVSHNTSVKPYHRLPFQRPLVVWRPYSVTSHSKTLISWIQTPIPKKKEELCCRKWITVPLPKNTVQISQRQVDPHSNHSEPKWTLKRR